MPVIGEGLLGLGVFVLMVALAVRVVFGSRPNAGRPQLDDPRTRALGILNERYARGEIDRDEYLERRAFLE